MEQFRYPFPGRELADRELSYDLCYGKIPEADRAPIVEAAWEKGSRAAKEVFAREQGSMDFYSIVRRSGLTLLEKDTDYVVGGQRYFSDYISGRKCINLYAKAIGMWARENGLEYQQAVNLILSHEYYHFLEVTRLGLTSRDYQVSALVLGPLKIGKTGIRALSEIGAHGFARTYYELWLEKERKQNGSEPEL